MNECSKIAKNYIKSIPSRRELENIFSKISFNSIEKEIFQDYFVFNKPLYIISAEINLSYSTVKRHFGRGLIRTFRFLIETNLSQ